VEQCPLCLLGWKTLVLVEGRWYHPECLRPLAQAYVLYLEQQGIKAEAFFKDTQPASLQDQQNISVTTCPPCMSCGHVTVIYGKWCQCPNCDAKIPAVWLAPV
jgi:hypothetical protein